MSEDNSEQAEFWTNAAGEKWVEQQVALDTFMQPVLDGLLTRSNLKSGNHVVDIGCGTGASALAALEGVGGSGSVLGVDISPTMLALAEKRGQGIHNLSFQIADAAHHTFEPSGFDHMISRFGVMFFNDPIQSFVNIFKSLKPGAHVTFASWGQIHNNPWFTIAAQAAKEHLGAPPRVDPDAPGPFAFRNADRVENVLSEAGFSDIATETCDLELTPVGTVAQVARMATSVGPAARTVAFFQGSDADSDAICDRVARAFEPFDTPSGVRVPAEINYVKAMRPLV